MILDVNHMVKQHNSERHIKEKRSNRKRKGHLINESLLYLSEAIEKEIEKENIKEIQLSLTTIT